MAFSDFSLADVKQKLGIKIDEQTQSFLAPVSILPSPMLQEWLKLNIPLAIALHNEKARSELMIAPILTEVKHRFPKEISLFSGIELNVDSSKGLVGTVDFLISKGPEQLSLHSPILLVVEAKREDMLAGLGQCAAEMVAAQILNQRVNSDIPYIYGVVTTGSLWQFMRLESQILTIDLNEYPLTLTDQLLGILCSMVVPHRVGATNLNETNSSSQLV